MGDNGNWCLIESDPGVFTQLIADMGVRDVQVEEVWDFDNIAQLAPVHGLVFLFKYQAGAYADAAAANLGIEDANTDSHIFFAKQVINNACATQAILSILMNSPDVEVGKELSIFREFAQELPPDMKGLAISNSDNIRAVHNSFARSEAFINDQQVPASDDDDLFHFISYMPICGTLYELDGLKPAPIAHGECSDADWLDKIRPVIEARMASYSSSEIRFNLMAVCQDRTVMLTEKLVHLEQRIAAVTQALEGNAVILGEGEEPLPTDKDALHALLHSLQGECELVHVSLAQEAEKKQRYTTENSRRKHNYTHFAFTLLQHLAAKGKLAPTVEQAKLKAAARVKKLREMRLQQRQQQQQ